MTVPKMILSRDIGVDMSIKNYDGNKNGSRTVITPSVALSVVACTFMSASESLVVGNNSWNCNCFKKIIVRILKILI